MVNLNIKPANEITLHSDDDPEVVVLNKVDFALEQSHRTRGVYRKITVFNGSYCQQSIKNKHEKKYNYRIDMAYLNPAPSREHHVAWIWAFSALGLALLSAIMIWAGWFTSPINPSVYYLTSVVAVVSVTLICLLQFAHGTYDKVIFRSQHGKVKLIELLNKYPDNKSFRNFIGQFIVRIKNAKSRKGLSPSKFLARELKELRRLRDEAVISAEIYEIAKAEIFNNESYQATQPRKLM